MSAPVEPRNARIAVVILNFRTAALVEDCIDSLIPEIDRERDVVVVVDNASGDGSVPRLRAHLKRYPGAPIRLVESSRNGGFAAGNNLGVGAVAADAYLLLNSDTLVRPGAVKTLWEALEAHPEAGLVSPRLEWPDGTPQISCFRFHTPLSELLAGARTGVLRHLLRCFEIAIPVRDEPFEPPWTSFAAVLIRGEALAAIGGLDEGFFMYYEDVDACRRLWRKGWRLRHEPTARIVHLRGGTSPVKALTAERKRPPRYLYAARARYFRKSYGRAGLLAANLLWTLGRSISWLRELFGEKEPHTAERELADRWRG
jgi:N-acetylglucosaminyl-diphospho-decaprenol L-rhamnosyltransferase